MKVRVEAATRDPISLPEGPPYPKLNKEVFYLQKHITMA